MSNALVARLLASCMVFACVGVVGASVDQPNKNYWSQTAMTAFLIDALKLHPLDFSTVGVTDDELAAYEPEHPLLMSLLYQTGYFRGTDRQGENVL